MQNVTSISFLKARVIFCTVIAVDVPAFKISIWPSISSRSKAASTPGRLSLARYTSAYDGLERSRRSPRSAGACCSAPGTLLQHVARTAQSVCMPRAWADSNASTPSCERSLLAHARINPCTGVGQ
eukprot:1656398-Pleurochrysis_carterae.AAC.1